MNTPTASPSTAMTLMTRAPRVLNNLPSTLNSHQVTVANANAAMKALIEKIERTGSMNAQLDREANDMLVNVNQAKKQLEESRKDITQIMDEVRTSFTSEEKQLDTKNPDSLACSLNGYRQRWANQQHEEAERIRKENERLNRVATQKAGLSSWILAQIGQSLTQALGYRKVNLNRSFNEITLANYEEKYSNLSRLNTMFPNDKLGEMIRYDLQPSQWPDLTETDINMIRQQAHGSYDFHAFYAQWNADLQAVKDDFLQRMPGLKIQLEEIAAAGEAEAARLKQEKEEQDRLAQEELERKNEEAQKLQQAKDELQGAQATTMAMFDTAANAKAIEQPTGQVRENVEIIVNTMPGWLDIVNFWYMKNAGGNPAEMGKVTLDKMKKLAEDCANPKKGNERIASKNLTYKTNVTAVNKK